MTPVWDADVEVDERIARGLIESQFPWLAPVRLETLGEGWDNAAWLVNDEWVFRFPRRSIGAPLIESETRFLPALAACVSIPIPRPELVGRPEAGYPHAFMGYRLLPGTTACSVALDDADRAALATPLARFLASLHGARLPDALEREAPGDVIGRTDLGRRARTMLARLERVKHHVGQPEPASIRVLAEDLQRTSGWGGPACWVHGDLYARHLLLDAERRLCGAIDFGDLHRGDPALDLAIAWSFLPANARDAFRAEYEAGLGARPGSEGGEPWIDDDTWRRARFNALHYAITLMVYGADVGDEALFSVGRCALRFAFDV